MAMSTGMPGWPPIGHQARTWEWTDRHTRPPSAADRLFRDYVSAVPADIAGRAVAIAGAVSATVANATARVAVLDASRAFDITALGGLLIRSESVASSKIERLAVSQRDVARALIGEARPSSVAARVAGNVHALELAVTASDDGPLTRGTLTAIHAVLMRDDERERAHAGVVRTEQNWIGGSDYTPRGAIYVPPRPELVPPLLDDLAAFLSRTDIDPIVQAAIGHAQFETIHPFVDGNGRAGRALVHLVLRRRGLATHTVVPVSTVLLARTSEYFHGLEQYRDGNLDAWVTTFADATATGASAALTLAAELAEIIDGWRAAARPRAGSAVASLLDGLARQPVVGIDQVAAICPGVDRANLHRAINRLVDAGVLVALTAGKRNRVWAANDVLELLERFERTVGTRATA